MWQRIRKHLVDDLNQAWKWASVRLAVLLLGLDVVAQSLPEVAAYLPSHWAGGLAIAILIGRVLKQQTKTVSVGTIRISNTAGPVNLTEDQLKAVAEIINKTSPVA